jgi:hypothetical protein
MRKLSHFFQFSRKHLGFVIVLLSVAFIRTANAETNRPQSVPALLSLLNQFMKDKKEVGQLLQATMDDFGKEKRRYPYTGFLDLSKTFEESTSPTIIRLMFRSSSQRNRRDYQGRGEMVVEYYPKDNILLLIGKNGMPSMKADELGNKVLTSDLKARVLHAVEYSHQVYSLVSAADDQLAHTNDGVTKEIQEATFKKLAELNRQISENETMLPDEASALLHELYDGINSAMYDDVKEPIIVNVSLPK